MLVVGWTFGRREWHVAAGFVALAAVLICILAFASRLLPSLLPSAVEEAGHRHPASVVSPKLLERNRRLGRHDGRRWHWLGARTPSAGGCGAWRSPAVCVAVPVAYMAYSRTAAIVTIVAALTVVALSMNRWLAAPQPARRRPSARRLVIFVDPGEPGDRRLHRDGRRGDGRARGRSRRARLHGGLVRRRGGRSRRAPATAADGQGGRRRTAWSRCWSSAFIAGPEPGRSRMGQLQPAARRRRRQRMRPGG